MYVIGEKPGEENSIIEVEDRQAAEALIKKIVDQLSVTLNVAFLSITRKEDDTIIKWQGKVVTTLMIREDDEVDLSFTNGQ